MSNDGDPVPARGGATDYVGRIHWEYGPRIDSDADPGEVVWAWVPFEDAPAVGKDRPIAIIGRTEDRRLVALMMSSRDHDGHPDWIAVGSGPWDRDGRPSWVRRDRLLAVAASAVRREGAVLPAEAYGRIAGALGGPVPGRPPRVGLRTRLRRLVGRG
ncbi:MAG: type II toxin-antitoxin system PemK/MazF family toxin [Actinomycetota bacterium]|nr:type II toxin-antitoxin system PemK/MazF family toxin [Actinomycetota bacterium]